MTLVANETLDLNATTFRTEAEKIIQAHPDAIMTEALGSADPTLFAEIKQLNGGKMIPIIGTSAAISPAFFEAAAKPSVHPTSPLTSTPTTWSPLPAGPPTRRSLRRCSRSRARSPERKPATSPPTSPHQAPCTCTTE